MDYSGYKDLLVEKKDYIATLTFNRPDKFNILSATLKEELNHCLETIADDDEVRVVILTGAGTIALCCDIIIADENARFGDLHVRGGLVAGDGGAVIWPLLLPLVKAKEYLLTGKLFDAKEAERIGLINKAVPTKDFWPTVNDMAQQILANAPQAVRDTQMAPKR